MGGGAAAAGIKILKSIDERMKAQLDHLKQASPAWHGVHDTLKRIHIMVLRPIGDFISVLARPYMMLMMAIARRGLMEARGVMKRLAAGEISPEEAGEEMIKIFSAMYIAMYPVQQAMMKIIGPMVGFSAAMEDIMGVSNSVIQSFRNFYNYLQGLLDTMDTVLDPEILGKAMGYLVGGMKDIGKTMRDKLDPSLTTLYDNFVDTGLTVEDFAKKFETDKEPWLTFINTFTSLQLAAALPFIPLAWLALKAKEAADELAKIVAPAEPEKPEKPERRGLFREIFMASEITGAQRGGYIKEAGIAYLHKGETVLPARASPTTNITINVDRPIVRSEEDITELVRKISRELDISLRRSTSYMVT